MVVFLAQWAYKSATSPSTAVFSIVAGVPQKLDGAAESILSSSSSPFSRNAGGDLARS